MGVASMAETGVLLDDSSEPVAPAIAWHDARGEQEARRITEELGGDHFTVHTGLRARPLCSISKYLWLRRHHPGASAGRRWLNVSEWIVHRLGARQAAELSLASRTGWLELATRRWWDEALALSAAPPGFLPEPVQAGTHLGRVSGRAPDGLQGAALTVAGHDHLCGAIGAGALGDDVVYDSCGTAEAFVAQMMPPLSAEQVRRLVAAGINVGWHVVDRRHALIGAQRAGLVLQRFLDVLGIDREDRDALDALDAAALAAPPDAGGMTVTAADGAPSALTGIADTAAPGLVWRAALNAVAARAADILLAMESERGAFEEVVVAGGWARNRALRTVKRHHQGVFHHAAGVVEPGVRGAALLGGVAAGVFGGMADLPAPRIWTDREAMT
jgi:sugar (pentulose or hexulose) kinase